MVGKIRFYFVIAVVFSFVFFACNNATNPVDNTGNSPDPNYPILRVVNLHALNPITSVSLVGYEFNHLRLYRGQSQTFILDRGMPGGYNNININIRAVQNFNARVNFAHGMTTVITLRGGEGQGSPWFNNAQLIIDYE